MRKVTAETTLQELAAIISQALDAAEIVGILSGGGAVAVYSANAYLSYDLDFVCSARLTVIGDAIAPLGFKRAGAAREFEHPDTPYHVEFPPGPLAFGERTFADSDAAVVETTYGPLRIVTPTQILMDRVAAYVHWNDNQSFDQAVMVAQQQSVDWPALYEWALHDGIPDAVIDKLRHEADD